MIAAADAALDSGAGPRHKSVLRRGIPERETAPTRRIVAILVAALSS